MIKSILLVGFMYVCDPKQAAGSSNKECKISITHNISSNRPTIFIPFSIYVDDLLISFVDSLTSYSI